MEISFEQSFVVPAPLDAYFALLRRAAWAVMGFSNNESEVLIHPHTHYLSLSLFQSVIHPSDNRRKAKHCHGNYSFQSRKVKAD